MFLFDHKITGSIVGVVMGQAIAGGTIMERLARLTVPDDIGAAWWRQRI